MTGPPLPVLPSKHNGCAVMHMQADKRVPCHLSQPAIVDVVVGRKRMARNEFANRFFWKKSLFNASQKSRVSSDPYRQ
jgi:hypothetical protein